MRENRFVLALFCFLCLNMSSGYAQSLSLEKAVEQTLQNNEKIKQYQEKVSEKKYQVNSAWGNMLPKVDASADYTHLSEQVQVNGEQASKAANDLVGPKLQQLPAQLGPYLAQLPLPLQQLAGALGQKVASYRFDFNNLPLGETDIQTGSILAVQPLYMGGKIRAGVKYAKAEYKSANIELEQVQNEMVKSTIGAYLGVALLEEVVDTRAKVLEGMRKHENQAERLIEEGVIPAYHLLRAKVAVASVEQELADDKNKLELAWLLLKTHLGYPEDTVLVLEDRLKFNIDNMTLTSAVNEAYASQPALQLIDQKEVMVKQNLNVKRSAFMPQLFAFGKYNFLTEHHTFIEPPFAVGLKLKLNLFNGFKDYHDYKSAKALQYQVDYARQDAKKKVNLWVNKSYKEVLNARDKYQKLDHTIRLAKESYRLNSRRFAEGMGTSLEVIDARLSLEGAQVKQLQALYEYYNALCELHLATGNPQKVVDILK